MAWNDLTPRQQQLDRAIEACGIKLENTKTCLDHVIRRIGAHEDERQFVLRRIQLRIRSRQLLGEADDLIARTERMLSDFALDDLEQQRIARRLGINLEDVK